MIENLVANAIRYTPRDGSVRIRCELAGDHVVLSVADTGIGISREDLPRVFDRFYRAGDSHGMGLGLAIAKDLIEAHGGTIQAQSEVGLGTTIECRLPISPSP